MFKILLAGASGMIGSKLIKKLKQKNYDFVLLSTQKKLSQDPNTLYWNPEKGEFPPMDLGAFDACINLCGAGIFEHRITETRKKILLNSRVAPIEFLKLQFESQNRKLPIFISASAIGIYPSICLNELREDSTQGQGFIAELVRQWEGRAMSMQKVANNVCIFRIGNVFSNAGGFLRQLAQPIRFYLGTVPGNGKQIISWIHIDDLCDMIIYSIENNLEGIFNAVSPHPETLERITRQVALKINKPLILPAIPKSVLKILFGKIRQELILSSQFVKSDKISNTGFTFKYRRSSEAINQLF